MKGNLEDGQAAMRERHSVKRRRSATPKVERLTASQPVSQEKRPTTRVPTRAELVQRALAGDPCGAPPPPILRSKNYMHRYESKQVVTQVKEVKVKAKKETHGKCWNKFGRANDDSSSGIHSSIRNWGLKMKARENRPS